MKGWIQTTALGRFSPRKLGLQIFGCGGLKIAAYETLSGFEGTKLTRMQ